MAIDPIKFNSMSYGHLERENVEERSEKEKQTQGEQQNVQHNQNLPADQVFSFLAQTNFVATPKVKPLDVSKYVNEEQAARIAGFVRGYEDSVSKSINAISSEFPNLDEQSKMALAVELFNNQNL